ncbi:MAG: glycogen synthase GlgA [Candidatus Omnitrophica bacterium]|nr:glycogen synthase GlgA [Candidatus Omnitrophota bacterium]
MNIVFATSEMVPFAKTGGLADVCGSLPLVLAEKGHTVKIFLPKYKMIDAALFYATQELDLIDIVLGDEVVSGKVHVYDYAQRVQVLFVENDDFFNRDDLYGTSENDYPDNDRRFIFFQKVLLKTLKAINFKPHILHCHDWQTALLPVYLKTVHKEDPFYEKTKTFLTIHNMAYQGMFSSAAFPLTGLSWDEFTVEKLEFYGKSNFLKGGILYADVLTTVSQRYAQEIQLKEFGCGLEAVIKQRRNNLYGIINGIDKNEWNPETDKDITVNFSINQLNKKYINKGVLQKENKLAVDRNVPLVGIVTRLTDQKGLDILTPLMPQLAQMEVQVVLLGTGDKRYNKKFAQFGEEYPDTFGVNIMFDAQMARRIYAGADMILMPSHFEPCGLSQLIGLRYGTVPLVRETGGLADTVIDFNRNTGKGNGFVFSEYTKDALLKTIQKALEYYKNKELWRTIVVNGMRCDFSWDASAEKYIELYNKEKKKDLMYA